MILKEGNDVLGPATADRQLQLGWEWNALRPEQREPTSWPEGLGEGNWGNGQPLHMKASCDLLQSVKGQGKNSPDCPMRMHANLKARKLKNVNKSRHIEER